MALANVEYTYGGNDTIPTTGAPPGPDMPDLTDETAPGADDGHNTRTSQIEKVRDLAIDNRTEIGIQTTPAAGSLRARATALEATTPTADQKAALAGTGTPSAGNVYVTADDSRLTDKRTASALGTSGAAVNVDAASPPSVGQVLKATSATVATWQAESGGGGDDPLYEAQVVTGQASLGTKTITVPTMRANAGVPGGFDLRWLSVNGILRKIVTTTPAGRECKVTAATTIDVSNSIDDDEIELSYGA